MQTLIFDDILIMKIFVRASGKSCIAMMETTSAYVEIRLKSDRYESMRSGPRTKSYVTEKGLQSK